MLTSTFLNLWGEELRSFSEHLGKFFPALLLGPFRDPIWGGEAAGRASATDGRQAEESPQGFPNGLPAFVTRRLAPHSILKILLSSGSRCELEVEGFVMAPPTLLPHPLLGPGHSSKDPGGMLTLAAGTGLIIEALF